MLVFVILAAMAVHGHRYEAGIRAIIEAGGG